MLHFLVPTLLKVSIGEASRTSSFFFENERDVVKKSVTLSPKVKQDLLDGYVGFWIRLEMQILQHLLSRNNNRYCISFRYKYDKDGSDLSLGLNGSPFTEQYALLSWRDTAEQQMKQMK